MDLESIGKIIAGIGVLAVAVLYVVLRNVKISEEDMHIGGEHEKKLDVLVAIIIVAMMVFGVAALLFAME